MGARGTAHQEHVWEDHLAEEGLEEKGAAARHLHRLEGELGEIELAGDAVSGGDGLIVLLERAGEVEPADQGLGVVGIVFHEVFRELAEGLLETVELKREGEERGPLLVGPVARELVGAHLGEPLEQGLEMLVHHPHRVEALGLIVGQGGAPDLLPLLLGEVCEELAEALQAIELREDQIHRDLRPEDAVHLIDALTDLARIEDEGFGLVVEEIRQAQGD